MRRIWKSLLVLVAAALAVVGMQTPASANTELVPGSRLIFPYTDISSGRETFLLITNAGTSNVSAHLEFYAQDCSKTDVPRTLSEKDLDVVIVSQEVGLPFFTVGTGTAQQAIAGIGWVDLDVRNNCTNSLVGCRGIQYNGLMGDAVVIDVVKDFAFAYPAASSQGSAGSGGTFGTIVVRDVELAARWEGSYETYPSTILIPGYFAEDECLPTDTLSAFISVVGPADAWRKEAPGSRWAANNALVFLDGSVYDGDENARSVTATAHQVNGRLCSVFRGQTPARGSFFLTSNFAQWGRFPSTDFLSDQAVSWLELSNVIEVPNGTADHDVPLGVIGNSHFTGGNGFDDSRRYRGVVGVLWEIQADDFVSGVTVKTADAIRAWADPATQIDYPCFGTEGPSGISPPTLSNGSFGNNPSCDAANTPVDPSWLGDKTEALNGR